MSPETLSLTGKTAIVTGSGRETGIGAAIARAFARNGALVAIHYVSKTSKARAEKVATGITEDFGTKAIVVQGSLEDPEAAKKMVEHVLKALGVEYINILVNNAAVICWPPLLEVQKKEFDQAFAVNVSGVIYMTQAVVGVGRMPQGGRIVNIGSIASKVLETGNLPVYGATKAATDALTTLFAGELGKSHGITVNTLAPGPVDTDMSKGYFVDSDGSPTAAQLAVYEQTRAANRIGAVEDLADATLLLVSEKSRWITAQYISVSGGITGV